MRTLWRKVFGRCFPITHQWVRQFGIQDQMEGMAFYGYKYFRCSKCPASFTRYPTL